MALKTLVHLLLAALFLFAAYYDLFVIRIPDVFRVRNEQSWGRSKYLSYWNLYFQTLFYCLSFLGDVLRRVRCCQPPAQGRCGASLDAVLDSAFAGVAFPVAAAVFTSFGLIFTMNRELAYPLMFDTFFPRWLTYIIQFLGLPAAVIEMLLVDHHYARHRRCNQLLLVLFLALNMGWMVIVGHTCQLFAYPALEPLTVGQQVGVVLLSAALGLVPYYLGEALYGARWGPGAPVRSEAVDERKRQ